ncbi:MAG TPA: hypothetical protein VKT78_04860 [Fimbriimonadaceae bacterium]|nr:hypothetical protein [Fimbriimonadaceae bacterium]
MSAVETEPKRKSPEVRLEPLRKIVLPSPVRMPGAFAEQFKPSTPRGGNGDLSKRSTPGARRMVERVPPDDRWYLVAITFSPGETTALASHISRGGYGSGVSVRRGPMPNENRANDGREPWCLLLKRQKPAGRRDR